MSDKKDDIITAFLEESFEHLSNIENNLISIEKAGADVDKDLINEVFRAAHTIKGGAGFIGLKNINVLAHKMENVLGLIRSGKLVPNAEIINFLLQGADTLQKLLKDVENSDKEDLSALLEALDAISIPTYTKQINLLFHCFQYP